MGLSRMMSVDSWQENPPDQELVKQGLTLLCQAAGYICVVGGVEKGRWERRYVEWGISFGPIVTHHIG